jgi:glycosyltransferase involved in cell wall biosynthesis
MVVGIALVKDEADIIEATVRQMLSQTSMVIIADNGSTDGTREILEDLVAHGAVIDDPDPAYFQSQKMSRLAAMAVEQGAEWVVPFDADEWWYSPFGRIADVLRQHPGAVAVADVYDHRATGLDPDVTNPLGRMGWRTVDPLPLHKVACRPVLPVTITQGNHGAEYPTQDPLVGQLVVRHFPIRSPEQMIRKARNGAAAYAATDLPEEIGQHWRDWGRLSDEQLTEVFRRHYWHANPANEGLIYDPCELKPSFPGEATTPTASVS